MAHIAGMLNILLAQVPGKREEMPEPGNHLTQVELACAPERTIIHEAVVLSLLQLEVQMKTALVRIG